MSCLVKYFEAHGRKSVPSAGARRSLVVLRVAFGLGLALRLLDRVPPPPTPGTPTVEEEEEEGAGWREGRVAGRGGRRGRGP